MQINRKISPYNYSSGNSIKYIVIHSTGNVNDTAKNNADYFYGGDRNASAHYFVDDNQIWQVVEEYNQAWHVGDGNGAYGIANYNSIGIEMCGTANGYISEQTINNTVQLVKQLMSKYGVSLANVVTHYNASRKNCPSQFSPNNWSRWSNFKSRLSGGATMNSNDGIVVADALNVRSGPGVNYRVIGQLNQGATVKINKKVNNFYDIYFGSNGGYISCDYVKTNFGEEKKNSGSSSSHRNCILYNNDVDKRAAEYLNDWFNTKNQDSILIHKKDYKVGMGRSVYAVGGGLDDIKANLYLKGSDRFDTLRKVVIRIGL